jgi:hypothetical protein
MSTPASPSASSRKEYKPTGAYLSIAEQKQRAIDKAKAARARKKQKALDEVARKKKEAVRNRIIITINKQQ